MDEIKLIVTDMDGTLLDGERQLPRHFASVVKALSERGIQWAIASGRQFANLYDQFHALGLAPDIIAENGAIVYEGGQTQPFFADLTPVPFFSNVLDVALHTEGATAVLCGQDMAWVQSRCPENFPQVSYYFYHTHPWDTMDEVANYKVCKVALYHPQAATVLWPKLSPLATSEMRVILSSPCWVDVQSSHVHKGHGLMALLEKRSLRPEQVMVFGDYLNDAEMMTLGTHAVAMGNAHPDLRKLCRHVTRPNTEDGVMWYLKERGLLASE